MEGEAALGSGGFVSVDGVGGTCVSEWFWM